MNLTETISLAKEGDIDAIELLYNEYKAQVYFFALKITGNEKDALAILQYTFYQAFQKLNLLKKPESFESWLYVIVAGKCVHDTNSLDLLVASNLPDGQKVDFNISNEPVSSPEMAEDDEAKKFISEIYGKMPIPQRLCAMMYFYCGLSFVQIEKIAKYRDEEIAFAINSADKILNEKIEQESGKLPSLCSYTGIAETGTILRSVAAESVIPENIDSAIINSAVTLLMSDIRFSPSIVEGEVTPKKEKAEKPAEKKDEKKKSEFAEKLKAGLNTVAARNIITILVVLLISAGIVAGSISSIRKAANNPPIETQESEKDTESVTGSETESESESESQTETETEKPADTESETVKETEPEDSETTKGEPVVSGLQLSKQEADEMFNYTVSGNTVTIKGLRTSVSDLIIPYSIDGKLVTAIAQSAFQKNTTLKSVVIADSVNTIGDYAFLECSNLETVIIPESVSVIGCSAFTKTAYISAQKDTFVIVGNGVLIRYNGSDKAVTVPSGVKYISNAFYFTTNVVAITVPEGVTGIGRYAFCYCSKLTTLTLPSSVTSIDSNAVESCPLLKAANISAPGGSYAQKWVNSHL